MVVARKSKEQTTQRIFDSGVLEVNARVFVSDTAEGIGEAPSELDVVENRYR